MTGIPRRLEASRLGFAQTLALLLLGLIPLPVLGRIPLPSRLAWARSALDSAHSPEMNRTDREINATGYYEGLVGGDGPKGAPPDLSMRLIGKPTDWMRFFARDVKSVLKGDPLMFELRPNVDRALFDRQRFTTNAFGMRSHDCTLETPPDTFRIALLGSSIDMGWGVGTDQTYASALEMWLNGYARKHGVPRKFEVLNFAVAAYSPMQRLEAFHRKAAKFHPDMILFAATMLDVRLMEIHVCDMLECRVDLKFDFLKRAIDDAGVTKGDLVHDPEDRLIKKDLIKVKLRNSYWPLYDATMATLSSDCQSMGVPLVCVIIPRAGKADAPEARAVVAQRLRDVLGRHADAVFDLSSTFDGVDPAKVAIAEWDDHPNVLGHRRLFKALAHALVDKYEPLLFPQAGRAAPPADVARTQP